MHITISKTLFFKTEIPYIYLSIDGIVYDSKNQKFKKRIIRKNTIWFNINGKLFSLTRLFLKTFLEIDIPEIVIKGYKDRPNNPNTKLDTFRVVIDNKTSIRKYGKDKFYKNLSRKLRIPPWANRQKIKEIYEKCPEGYEVDHIIPINGKYISGLHIETNLQYLLKKDNRTKSNKYEI